MQSNTQLIIEELRSKRTYPFDDHKPIHPSNPPPHLPMYRTPSRLTFGGLTSDMDPMQHNWQITLTQRGIRIDTNIASIPDLYDILLKGVNRLSIRSDSPQVPAAKSKHRPNENPDSPISSPPSAPGSPEDIESAVVVRNYPFWKPSTLSFPLYNVWESEADHRTLSQVDAEQIPQETVDRLMDDYVDCILVMQLPDKRGFLAQYYNRTLDPLVSNAILSWTARHSAIYHNRFPGKDPNTVGEHFFQRAKNLLKDRVFESSIVTIHALLMMYLYQVGKMGPTRQETQSEAYLFLGMANRMSLDLKLHQPKPDLDPISQETYRRFFWTGYFLELLASAHMEKPSIVPDRDTITIAGCRPMDHEDDDTRYKVEFIFHRHRIALIYRDITLNLTREEPLLSAVSTLDRKLKAWYHELPAYFRWQMGSTHDFRSASFREQSCLKLMCEYHFCHLQLYRPFLAPPGNTPSTIAILSQDICIKSASAISAILERYTHLKADWCHFTIDAFAMGCLVHQHVVVGVDRRSAEASRLWLVRSVALLKRCPVRHHKAVSSLARSVEEFLVQRGMDPREHVWRVGREVRKLNPAAHIIPDTIPTTANPITRVHVKAGPTPIYPSTSPSARPTRPTSPHNDLECGYVPPALVHPPDLRRGQSAVLTAGRERHKRQHTCILPVRGLLVHAIARPRDRSRDRGGTRHNIDQRVGIEIWIVGREFIHVTHFGGPA
ncbi:hypothetical protein BC936DRAFT_149253 [Jimgerdemannia flammicorona]|uniref:Xylanolytic transcriptional activator regulatory domain-containing protein n=1 Tax=Jimgerdemannia flammicorona TaxID=994334 RepID=A0A433DK57_9FUNG|nr:hypothetical protein BC936DRAFT_149253 [Jimgerdemannia flammicorona]